MASPKPKSGSRFLTEAKKIPELILPPVLFPYGKMGQSASGLDWVDGLGTFGLEENWGANDFRYDIRWQPKKK